ncbi:MAG: hypothetical protein KF819_32000 [Labilithrix sp.]|nr:hypothetical protein [Labilithrix sp.]
MTRTRSDLPGGRAHQAAISSGGRHRHDGDDSNELALPADAPARGVVLPIVLRLWGERGGTAQSAEDEDFYMSTHAIVQQWERELLEKGRGEGVRDVLTRLLRARFGPLDAATESRIAKATVGELERWTERVIVAVGIDDVFKE